MKRLLMLAGVLLAMETSASAQVSASFGLFYSSLSPQGEWIAVNGGVYAWHPYGVAVGWRPYTVGEWVWTDDGWYWMSDEPWGWATYHYGRWYYDDFYGWVWVPGYQWAPAWVDWRYGDDCIGWAPLGPYAVFSVNVGIFYRTPWHTPYSWWSFADYRYFGSPGIHRHLYMVNDNRRLFGSTRGAGNIRWSGGRVVGGGPDREIVERRGNVRLQAAEIVDGREHGERMMREGERERIQVFRPRIAEQGSGAVERPASVREAERPIRLEADKMDVRIRDQERATGRDMQRAEQYRKPETGAKPQSRGVEQRQPAQPRTERKDQARETQRRTESARPGKELKQQPAQQPGRRQESVQRQRQPQPAQPRMERRNDGREKQRRVESARPERQWKEQSPPPQPERRQQSYQRQRQPQPEFRSSRPERTMRRPEASAGRGRSEDQSRRGRR